jgi:hypothetical protein
MQTLPLPPMMLPLLHLLLQAMLHLRLPLSPLFRLLPVLLAKRIPPPFLLLNLLRVAMQNLHLLRQSSLLLLAVFFSPLPSLLLLVTLSRG